MTLATGEGGRCLKRVESGPMAMSAAMSGLLEHSRPPDIGRLSERAIPVIAAIRGTGFMECRRRSLRLDACGLDDRPPFLDVDFLQRR
jgi:hypothetical protein